MVEPATWSMELGYIVLSGQEAESWSQKQGRLQLSRSICTSLLLLARLPTPKTPGFPRQYQQLATKCSVREEPMGAILQLKDNTDMWGLKVSFTSGITENGSSRFSFQTTKLSQGWQQGKEWTQMMRPRPSSCAAMTTAPLSAWRGIYYTKLHLGWSTQQELFLFLFKVSRLLFIFQLNVLREAR